MKFCTRNFSSVRFSILTILVLNIEEGQDFKKMTIKKTTMTKGNINRTLTRFPCSLPKNKLVCIKLADPERRHSEKNRQSISSKE